MTEAIGADHLVPTLVKVIVTDEVSITAVNLEDGGLTLSIYGANAIITLLVNEGLGESLVRVADVAALGGVGTLLGAGQFAIFMAISYTSTEPMPRDENNDPLSPPI
jgi:hypothetical protein